MNDKKKKKKFKETGLGKFLLGAGSSIVDIVGDVIPGGNILKTLIEKDEALNQEQKEIALKHLEADLIEAQEVTKRWEADMLSDSWLSKNIRPLVLAYLTLATSVYIILDASNDGFDIKTEWISLLSSLLLLVYGGYFGARTAEKIFANKKLK